MNPIILIMTLNMNGLNIPIKIHGLKNNNHDPTVHCLQETHSILKDISRLKTKRYKNKRQKNNNHKRADVAVIMSNQIDIKETAITRDNEWPLK